MANSSTRHKTGVKTGWERQHGKRKWWNTDCLKELCVTKLHVKELCDGLCTLVRQPECQNRCRIECPKKCQKNGYDKIQNGNLREAEQGSKINAR
jgi:hypothetical protein